MGKNQEIAKIFFGMADLLEMLGVEWKPAAFRKAARNIENLQEDVEDIFKSGGAKELMEIPGVGKNLAAKIGEFILTGKISEYQKLKKQIPAGVEQMLHIYDLGPKRAWKLYKENGIDSVDKLEKAASGGRVRLIRGFGEKSEKDILKGIELFRKGQQRMLLGDALPLAGEIVNKLKQLKEVQKIEIAGSIRRRKETVRDIDILVISKNPEKVMDFFVSMPNVELVQSRGTTKSSVTLKEGLDCDLRVLDEKSFGAALNYFTGSVEHNVKLRQIAIKKGMKLSEYGLFSRAGKFLAGKSELDIYKKLGLPYIDPELRENTGEIEAGYKRKLPDIINYGSLKGDLHMHTNWSDGGNTTEEMVQAAIKAGLQYIAITDHSKSEYVARGLDEKRLAKHMEEIEKMQKKYTQIKILKGAEVDILPDGSLDYSAKILRNLDVVVASVHSKFKSPMEEMTRNVLKAMDSGFVTILGHPTGRKINVRGGFEMDMEKVMEAAKSNGVFLEIDSTPLRLDLRDSHIRKAVEMGCKFSIDSDAHSVNQLANVGLGIAQARRGWCPASSVINSFEWKKLEKMIRK